jgi:hypothetical protein
MRTEFTTFNLAQCKEYQTQSAAFNERYFNRPLKKSQIKKIYDAMPECLPLLPAILVNVNTKHILDGQHRVAAFVKAMEDQKIPSNSTLTVKLINVTQDEELKIIKSCNGTSSVWSINVRSAKAENGHVNRVLAFSNGRSRLQANGKPKVNLCFQYVCGCSESFIKDNKSLEDFEVSDYNLELAARLYTEITSIFDVLDFSEVAQEKPFIAVWRANRNKMSMNEWLRGFRKKKNDIRTAMPKTVKEWTLHLDSVRLYVNDTRNAL